MGMKLKNDFVFKAVFGRDTEESKQALIGMLNLILDRKEDPIRNITYRNPFNVKEFEQQKEGILDIKAETDSGELFDIEMQFVYDEEFIERDVYYHCGMVMEGLAAGQSYGMLKKTISIYLMDHIWFVDNNNYHNCYQLREKNSGALLTDLLEMHYFELPKVNPGRKKTPENMTEAERFLEYLRLAGEAESRKDDYFDILRRIGGKEIKMTEGIMRKATEDEILREKAIARDKFLHMQASLDRQRKRVNEELADKKQRLAESEKQLADKKQRLAESEKQLAENEKQLAENEKQLAENEKQLAGVKNQLAEKDKIIEALLKENAKLRGEG